jgi:excinuclease ABC subunit C
LPSSSGVYWFKDGTGSVLYVGKAKNLNRRLRSYRQTVNSKTRVLIAKIQTVNWLTTESELAALLLEAAYINAFQPPYNVRLKDDRSPIYIAITKEPIPRVLAVRKTQIISHKPDAISQFFGPFPSAAQTRALLRALRKIIPFCSAGRVSSRPCFYYQLKLCPGVCAGIITPGQYRRQLRYLTSLLDPLSHPPVTGLGGLRQLLLPYFPHLPSSLQRIEAYDISNLSGQNATGAMVVFSHGRPDNSQYRRFRIHTQLTPNDPAMMAEILHRRFKHPEWNLPDLIVLDGGLPQLAVGLKATHIPLITLAKRQEIIFTHQGPIQLPRTSPPLKLLQHLRDQAHRFARSYHRQLRDRIN